MFPIFCTIFLFQNNILTKQKNIAIIFLEVSTMRENHLWNKAKDIKIVTSPEIVGNFDIGFDSKIPEETKDQLIKFVYWVEDHFHLPVTLWVDFKYNHYLISKSGKRVGYNSIGRISRPTLFLKISMIFP